MLVPCLPHGLPSTAAVWMFFGSEVTRPAASRLP